MKKEDIIKNWNKTDEELYGTKTNKVKIFKNEIQRMIKLQEKEEIKRRVEDAYRRSIQ